MRIIAGTHRGRPIRAPSGMRTRPTADRVREALFSILGDLDGLRVLDCYAGSGALGLEALSRGAAAAVFVESGREACEVIGKNASGLGLSERCTLIRRELERSANALSAAGPFDLILADPPWPIALSAGPLVADLARKQLRPDGRLVLGHPTKQPVTLLPELGFELQQTRHWGDSAMSFYQLGAGLLDR
jgi:16S rRNA (guanine966-N2)-methyltransferase